MDEMTPGANIRRNAIAAFVSVVFFGPTLYWLIDRERPYDWVEGRIIPVDPRPGDWLEVEWVVKTRRVCDGTVQRQITMHDGTVLNYDPVPAIRRDQLSGDRLYRQFPLSTRAVPGTAKYRARTCYECNPLQHWWPICVTTPDIVFMIRERDSTIQHKDSNGR